MTNAHGLGHIPLNTDTADCIKEALICNSSTRLQPHFFDRLPLKAGLPNMATDTSHAAGDGAENGRRPGFNVIGHLSASSGLGNTARLYIQMLQKLGYGVAGIDVDYDGGTERRTIEGVSLVKADDELPYSHSLIIVSIQLLPSLWLRRLPGLLAEGKRNVGIVFWELPVVPKAWWPSLALFDAILTCSPFVRHAIETAVPDVPTLHAEHPLLVTPPKTDRVSIRARLDIPLNAFVCCTSFDLRSDYARKNPGAAVNAFLKAFPSDSDVRLIIKTNGNADLVSISGPMKKLIELIRSDRRIILMTETVPYDEVQAIYGAADVFVSLHRAEGLGLGPMEAMLLGKLVIATGYSGNMAYMTEQNSMPIPYRLVEPRHVNWQYKRPFAGDAASWAEADTEQAVSALRTARSNPGFRKLLAARGEREIRERQLAAWSGNYLMQLMNYLDAGNRPPLRKALVRQVRQMEIKDPTLRKLNLGRLLEIMRKKVSGVFCKPAG